MRTLAWVVAGLVGSTHAWAGEVHTRGTAGTWTYDAKTGLAHGSIPNDTGYSFWVRDQKVDLSHKVVVTARVRFVTHIDYGGAGIALVDPRANGKAQPNVRIELSERDDTVGVGGWLGNENNFPSGAGTRAGKDIKTDAWYELRLEVEGRHATGFLDGKQVYSADIPELDKLPRQLAIATFVIEADAEMAVAVTNESQAMPVDPYATAPAAPAADTGVKVQLVAWGRDETDGSDVGWDTKYPHPSFDDDPRRRGTPNAAWDASYAVRGDQLCMRVEHLHSPNPPTHTLALGYVATLDGATFSDGAHTHTFVVYRFSMKPPQTSAELCEPIKIASSLPASSKPQAEIEKLFAARIAKARKNAEIVKLYDHVDELILVVGKHHFLLDPITREWLYWDRLHKTWEPTGWQPGDATFSEKGGKIVVRARAGARRLQ
jgi:hypothetical protein